MYKYMIHMYTYIFTYTLICGRGITSKKKKIVELQKLLLQQKHNSMADPRYRTPFIQVKNE